MSKPTIIIVPGAWHTPVHFGSVISYLESKGYPTICKQNQSCGATDPKIDNNDDTAAIRQSVDSVDGDVIIFMHSYAGLPGACAATGAKNVIGLIFVASFVLPSGGAIDDASKFPESWAKIDPKKGTIPNIDPRASLYHDADEADIQKAVMHLVPQNLASFRTASKETSWSYLPKIYAVCTDDRILPPKNQKAMVERAGNWLEVKYLDTSHSPWMSKDKKDEFNAWLVSAVEKFVENRTKSKDC